MAKDGVLARVDKVCAEFAGLVDTELHNVEVSQCYFSKSAWKATVAYCAFKELSFLVCQWAWRFLCCGG